MDSLTTMYTDDTDLDRRLLRIFRLFTTIMWPLLTLGVLAQLWRGGQLLDALMLGNWVQITLLLVYLWWGVLRSRLGPRYLPIGLACAAVGPILLPWLLDTLSARIAMVDRISALGGLYFWLLPPLVLTSARYQLGAMFLLTGGTTLLSVLLTLFSPPTELLPNAQGVIVRGLILSFAGYLIVQIGQAYRQQQHELVQRNAELRTYSIALDQLATSRERNRLARELHDTLAHTLSAIDVQLKALDVQLADVTAARSTLQQTQELTRTGLHEARRALQALRAQPVEQLGLVLAIRQLAERTAQRTGTHLRLDLPTRSIYLPATVEQQLYRAAEEALHNAARHAQARTLTVALHADVHQATLTVRDDGIGFDAADSPPNERYGLRGLHERAALIGGDVAIMSAPGAGTVVRMVVPIERPGNTETRG